MHPYRTAVAEEEEDDALPPLPMLRAVPQVLALGGCCAMAGLCVWAATRLASQTALLAPAPPAPRTFDVATLLELDATALAALRDHAVIVRGVVRERRHDSFGNVYFELGRGLGYEVPVVQCFLGGAGSRALARGTTATFHARVLGKSLAVAVQLDGCALMAEE